MGLNSKRYGCKANYWITKPVLHEYYSSLPTQEKEATTLIELEHFTSPTILQLKLKRSTTESADGDTFGVEQFKAGNGAHHSDGLIPAVDRLHMQFLPIELRCSWVVKKFGS